MNSSLAPGFLLYTFFILIGFSRWILKEREGAKDERQSFAYLRTRYGEFPESRKEVNQVEAARKRVPAAGKVLLQEKKLKNEPRLPGVIHDR